MGGFGCHAQTPPASQPLTQDQTNRRIEIIVRSHFELPADVVVHIGKPGGSDLVGYHTIPITLSQGEKTSPVFLFEISDDGKTFAQFEKYDLTKDPKDKVSIAGRPARGPANAPVLIVSFDDLECPYCSKMHAQLFPDALMRYGSKIRIIYKDFPLTEIHPWAMHAAVDANCLAAQSDTGYWDFVDYAHAHGADITGKDNKPEPAFAMLDKQATDEGTLQKVNLDVLKACIAKQDLAAIQASVAEGRALDVKATPTLFINGQLVDGAIPEDQLWNVIDSALTAEGIAPPANIAPPVNTTPPASTPPPAK